MEARLGNVWDIPNFVQRGCHRTTTSGNRPKPSLRHGADHVEGSIFRVRQEFKTTYPLQHFAILAPSSAKTTSAITKFGCTVTPTL